jgi:uncharacterized protein (DUF427 family)
MPSAPTADTSHYPKSPVAAGHVEPSPRRLRGVLDGETILDTQGALYFWEHPHYPQYYVPVADVDPATLARLGDAARVVGEGEDGGAPAGTVRIEWGALEAWYEEDERVFVHPRSPYARVDVLRSNRPIRIEIGGVVLAEGPGCVKLFETGLPARHYIERTSVDFTRLAASDTVSSCPYKGTTSGYWSARIGDELREDIAWSYEFPTPDLAKIAGLVAFYDEKVDTFIDGVPVERPRTKFSGDDS